jgi:hypothetical protein
VGTPVDMSSAHTFSNYIEYEVTCNLHNSLASTSDAKNKTRLSGFRGRSTSVQASPSAKNLVR